MLTRCDAQKDNVLQSADRLPTSDDGQSMCMCPIIQPRQHQPIQLVQRHPYNTKSKAYKRAQQVSSMTTTITASRPRSQPVTRIIMMPAFLLAFLRPTSTRAFSLSRCNHPFYSPRNRPSLPLSSSTHTAQATIGIATPRTQLPLLRSPIAAPRSLTLLHSATESTAAAFSDANAASVAVVAPATLEEISRLEQLIQSKGNEIRSLKENGISKSDLAPHVQELLGLKTKLPELSGDSKSGNNNITNDEGGGKKNVQETKPSPAAPPKEETMSTSELRASRLAKVTSMRESGVEPYAYNYKPNRTASQLAKEYEVGKL